MGFIKRQKMIDQMSVQPPILVEIGGPDFVSDVHYTFF